MYVVTVLFEPKPERVEAFRAAMLANAKVSRETEPGCRQFDVCVDASRPGVAFLYELYDDRAAFDAHLASPHFKAFAAATEAMIDAKRVATWQRAAP